MPSVIVLLGPPGSGKGTQAKRLSAELGLPHISTGDILRDAVSSGTELGRKVKAIMDAGELVSDAIVDGIVRERVAWPDVSRGYILDGYPRTVGQAEFLQELVTGMKFLTLNIDVGDEELVRRLSGRRTCAANGHIFHVESNPSARANACDEDGSPLIQRSDDREEVVRQRLSVYHRDTAPLIDYFRSRPGFHQVQGNRSPDEVFRQVQRIISAA